MKLIFDIVIAIVLAGITLAVLPYALAAFAFVGFSLFELISRAFRGGKDE